MPIRPSNTKICAKCRKPVSKEIHNCVECASYYHRSCAVLFIKFKPSTVFCARTLAYLLTTPPSPNLTALPLLPTSGPSLSHTHLLLTSSAMTNPTTTSAITSNLLTTPSIPIPSLPADWHSLDTAQQLSLVMQTCLTSVKQSAENGAMLANLVTAVESNTVTCAANSSEIHALKNLRAYSQQTPEIIVSLIMKY